MEKKAFEVPQMQVEIPEPPVLDSVALITCQVTQHCSTCSP